MREGVLDETRAYDTNRPVQSFVRVGNFYVNARLDVLRLGGYLWSQFEQFLGSEGKARISRGGISGALPPAVKKAARVAKHLMLFVLTRPASRFAGNDEALALPVSGDLAIVRKSGAIKVLDIRSSTVYTLMSGVENGPKLRERVEFSRQIAPFPFAPAVKEVDLNGGYFAEEFVSGTHPLNFLGCKDDFAEVYQPLLLQFLRAYPPRWHDSGDYISRLRTDILAKDGLLTRVEPDQRRSVVALVEEASQRLAGMDEAIPLVLSHGDYFSGNIVIDRGKHRAIDWANMGFRSPLHDLYYLYMNHCCRVLDQRALELRSHRAIARLREKLLGEDAELTRELAGWLSERNEYRWLFYLECIQVPLVRCSSEEDRYLASMLVRVSWFREYERALAVRAAEGETGSADTAVLRPTGASNT